VSGDPQPWLWKTNGTPAGTQGVAAVSTFTDSGRMAVSGSRVFVPGSENYVGASLWASDGTAAGTVHLSGLAHGGDFTELSHLTDAAGTLFFTAYELGYGWEVWKSDGTLAGTTLVKASGLGDDPPYDAFGEIAALPGGTVFFGLREADAGIELWKSDGTPAGTLRVADIFPGAGSSNPHQLTPAGDRLYFVANDGVHGDEPWVTDGTAAGTHMVADLLPGADSSHPDAFAAVGTTLLFSATDGVHGVEAWRTGGRTLGTRMLQDIAPGPLSASPSGFTAAGPNVYFAASDHTTGFELWAAPLTNVLSSFGDVPTNFWAWSSIEAIAAAGITTGCAPGQYCPTSLVSRAEMAAFLERGVQGPAFTPPPPTGTVFADVPAAYWAAGWIEQLAADGITTGCSPGHYCPDLPVNRSEMAVFLLRARHGGSYVPPHVAASRFADVPAGYWAQDWIEELAAEAITTGCAPNSFCPGDSVGRDQMAAFLARTFHLTAP
jgi:ELWxxDGT repeat protein